MHRQLLWPLSWYFKSFLMVFVQFLRGLPLLFLPSGTQCNIWLALPSFFMQHTCPNRFNLFFLMMFLISSCPVLYLIPLFEILSCHDTCRILLSHLWCTISCLLLFATVIGQVPMDPNPLALDSVFICKLMLTCCSYVIGSKHWVSASCWKQSVLNGWWCLSIYLSIYEVYIMPLQGNYPEALPAQARAKIKVLRCL